MERAPGGMLDTTMRLLMRKNSVYIAFIFTGAIIGERIVDYGINKVWDNSNVGIFIAGTTVWFTCTAVGFLTGPFPSSQFSSLQKRFQDIPKLGSKVEES